MSHVAYKLTVRKLLQEEKWEVNHISINHSTSFFTAAQLNAAFLAFKNALTSVPGVIAISSTVYNSSHTNGNI